MHGDADDQGTAQGSANRKRILLTGGNGFVGLRLARLLARDHAVCIVDSLRYGEWRFSEAERANFHLVQTDIRDHEALSKVMNEWSPEIIIHLAAIHYIPECENEPALAVSTNVTGTVNLLQSAPAGCRFVFASSGAVYKPEAAAHDEARSETGPSDIYGLTKLHGEQYVTAMAEKLGLAGVIIRLFNVAGPGETNPHLLPEMVAQLQAGRDCIELGNLTPQRDYIDVRDAASGFAAAALGQHVGPGETCIVNLGSGQAASVEEVVTRLRDISGVRFAVIQHQDRIRKVDRPLLLADNARMDRYFGWRPSYSLGDSLAALWVEPDLAPRLVARYR